MILLIPAALGLAFLVEFLERRGWAVAGWIVALVCLAEQAVTTDTFDAAANQASIADIARRIDRGRDAFYYHPCHKQRFFLYQLDAMWASLATGKPTINGYSGYAPPDWVRFFIVDFIPRRGGGRPHRVGADGRGLSPDRVQWIGRIARARTPIAPLERQEDRRRLGMVPGNKSIAVTSLRGSQGCTKQRASGSITLVSSAMDDPGLWPADRGGSRSWIGIVLHERATLTG